MKVVRSVNFVYTLYEDDCGAFVLDLVIASADSAWANYEKRVVLSTRQKILINVFPDYADRLASKLLAEEKARQKMTR